MAGIGSAPAAGQEVRELDPNGELPSAVTDARGCSARGRDNVTSGPINFGATGRPHGSRRGSNPPNGSRRAPRGRGSECESGGPTASFSPRTPEAGSSTPTARPSAHLPPLRPASASTSSPLATGSSQYPCSAHFSADGFPALLSCRVAEPSSALCPYGRCGSRSGWSPPAVACQRGAGESRRPTGCRATPGSLRRPASDRSTTFPTSGTEPVQLCGRQCSSGRPSAPGSYAQRGIPRPSGPPHLARHFGRSSSRPTQSSS